MSAEASQAASRLLQHLQAFASYDPRELTTKYVAVAPCDAGVGGGGAAASATTAVVFTPQQFLAHAQTVWATAASAVPAEQSVLLLLARTAASHIAQYDAEVYGAAAGEAEDAATAGAAGHRGAFIAWVALHTFRSLLREGAASLAPDMDAESRRLQSIYDLLDEDATAREGVSPPATAGATVGASDAAGLGAMLRRAAAALDRADEEAGDAGICASPLSAHPCRVVDFVRARIVPAILETAAPCGGGHPLEELLPGDGAPAPTDTAYPPFHPFSPGHAAASLASSLMGSQPDVGLLVRRARDCVLAHERRAQQLGRASSALLAPDPVATGAAAAASLAAARIRRHALALVHAAVQLFPTSVLAGDEVVGAGAPPPGAWLLEHTRRRQAGHVVRLLYPPRRCMLLPGLSIAATEVAVGETSAVAGSPTSTGDPPAAERMAPASTLLVAPHSARLNLLLREEEGERLPPPLSAGEAVVCAPHHLRPVAALFLLTSLPPPEEGEEGEEGEGGAVAAASGWAALASSVARVSRGVVLFVVGANIARGDLRRIEGWGSPARTVVAVGSVGEWGLAQLSRRFDCVPTTPAAHLRAVKPAATGGTAGLLLIPLDETDMRREVQSSAPAAAGAGGGGGRTAVQRARFVEVRRRLVVVVGSRCGTKMATTTPPTAPLAMQPADDSDSSTSSLSTSDSSSRSSGRDGMGSDGGGSAPPASCGGQRVHYDPSSSPFSSFCSDDSDSDSAAAAAPPLMEAVGFARCSVLLGGAAPAIQAERLVVFRRVFSTIAHRRVLPPHLTARVAGDCDGAVDLAVLSTLDEEAAAPGSDVAAATPAGAYRVSVARGLREALWQYLLLCEVRCAGGCPVEGAWEALTSRQQEYRGGVAAADTEPCGGREVASASSASTTPGCSETVLQVVAAYEAVGRCLDDLCSRRVLPS